MVESNLMASLECFIQYINQVYGTRAVGVGGVFREYFRELVEESEDLIGKGEEEQEEVDEGYLLFGWKRREKKYKMIQ